MHTFVVACSVLGWRMFFADIEKMKISTKWDKAAFNVAILK